MPSQMTQEADEIAFRMERYSRPEFAELREVLSRGECDRLTYWRRVVPFEEFSATWNNKPGQLP